MWEMPGRFIVSGAEEANFCGCPAKGETFRQKDRTGTIL
jgi:hypothetical protein